jgi:replicative DNA helicase
MVAGALNSEDFGDRNLAAAFDAMVSLSRDHRTIDTITLAAEGVSVPDLDILAASRGGGLPAHINLVKEAAFRRQVHGQASKVIMQTEAGSSNVDILASLQQFNSALQVGGDTQLISSDRAADLYLQALNTRKTQGVGLSYGLSKLDYFLQPAHGGDMVVVAARPSVGKTAFAETIADHWATGDGFPVLFASIEMSLSQLMDRAVSRTAGIPAQHLVRGTLSADEEVLAAETVERRKAVKIWYYDDGYATTETLRAQAARCAMVNGGIRGIVVDYLQILKDAGDQEVQRVTKISRNIKALAREYDCPVLALSQLNRQSEYRPDPHPRLADIRESGAIEQDADVVLGLYRDRAMEDSFDGSDLEVDILKNRQGPSQMRVVIPFHGETVSFERE